MPAEIAEPYPRRTSSPAQGATLWMAYLTAYGALVHYGKLSAPDDAVIITASSSSVGLAAIQIAKERGATVIATTRSLGQEGCLSSASAPITSSRPRRRTLPARVMEITGGAGARVILRSHRRAALLTTLCGACSALRHDLRVRRAPSLARPSYPLMPMLAKSLTIVGLPGARFRARRGPLRGRAGLPILRPWKAARSTPVIDREFPLEQIVAAHRHMESNTQCGKIVVTV